MSLPNQHHFYASARSRLKELVRLGYLQPKGKGRATTYYWT
jgi:hypothetical protein